MSQPTVTTKHSNWKDGQFINAIPAKWTKNGENTSGEHNILKLVHIWGIDKQFKKANETFRSLRKHNAVYCVCMVTYIKLSL